MLQKYDNWWQDKKLESDLEEQQRSSQVYNDPPKDNVGINSRKTSFGTTFFRIRKPSTHSTLQWELREIVYLVLVV